MNRPKIKELRKEKGLTQQEMADYFNIPLSTFTNYENGYRQIPNDLLVKFEEFFGVGISIILNVDDKETSVRNEIRLDYVKFISNIKNMNDIDKHEALRIYDSLFDFLNSITKNNHVQFKNRDIDYLMSRVARMNKSNLDELINFVDMLLLKNEQKKDNTN